MVWKIGCSSARRKLDIAIRLNITGAGARVAAGFQSPSGAIVTKSTPRRSNAANKGANHAGCSYRMARSVIAPTCGNHPAARKRMMNGTR